MILYQVVSTYQLLCAVVHKQKEHKADKCVIFVPFWLVKRFPQYEKLRENFDDIVVYAGDLKITNQSYPKKNTPYFNKLFKQKGYSIKDFTEIHSMACHYSFGAYLAHENIPFIFWEDASGLLSKTDVICDVDRKANGNAKADYCLKSGLYDGTAPSVIKRVCNFKAQKSGFDFANTEDFDVVESYASLSKEEQLQIRRFFTDVEDITIPEGAVLFLTQHFANLKTLTFEEQILIYQLTLDYFFADQPLVFKTHPDDIMYYGMLFPKAKLIRNKFPSEFLPTMFVNKPKTIATVSSTAINNLKGYFDETFELGNRFEKDFKAIHRYNTVLKLKETVFPQSVKVLVGADEQLVHCLTKGKKDKGNSKFYIVDDLSTQEKYSKEDIVKLLEKLPKEDVVAFVNFKQDFCFYSLKHKKIWKNIVPIMINKTQNRLEEFYDDLSQEIVYIYTNNEEIVRQISKFSFNKSLEATGETIQVNTLTGEKRSIKVLEGLLKASEKLLREFIDLEESGDPASLKKIEEEFKKLKIEKVKFSSDDVELKNISEDEKQIRILEGIIKSVEQRMLFYVQK